MFWRVLICLLNSVVRWGFLGAWFLNMGLYVFMCLFACLVVVCLGVYFCFGIVLCVCIFSYIF